MEKVVFDVTPAAKSAASGFLFEASAHTSDGHFLRVSATADADQIELQAYGRMVNAHLVLGADQADAVARALLAAVQARKATGKGGAA